MRILANALPGFRDLRTPVVAGYLWLLFAWLLVDPDTHHRPTDQLGAAIFDLGHDVGHIGIAIAASAAAYLVGSVSRIVSEVVGELLRRVTLPWMEVDFGARGPAEQELSELWQSFADEQGLTSSATPGDSRGDVASDPEMSRLDHDLRRRYERARAELGRELALPATLLVGKEPELFAEVDRLRAEGELRLSAFPPLLALLVLVGIHSPWWFLGIPLLLMLLIDGVRRDQDSRSLIANAISRGMIKSASVERFRDWISSERMRLASDDPAPRRGRVSIPLAGD